MLHSIDEANVRHAKGFTVVSVPWDERKITIPTCEPQYRDNLTVEIRALDLAAWCRKVKIKTTRCPVDMLRKVMGW